MRIDAESCRLILPNIWISNSYGSFLTAFMR